MITPVCPGEARKPTVYSLGEAIEDIDQLGQALLPLDFPLLDAFGDALLDMTTQHRQADPVERRLGCRELLEDLDAEPRFLDHSPDAAHLPLDTVQARNQGLLLGGIQHKR